MYATMGFGRVKNLLMQGAAALAVLATSNPAFAQDAKTGVRGVDDIIVTARRKEEKNQDVPVSITAFSNERIAQMNIVDTQSLQATVPSLVVGANGQGSRNTQSRPSAVRARPSRLRPASPCTWPKPRCRAR